ncbi:MAG: DsbA family protein [Burkholderiaceae bacterium]
MTKTLRYVFDPLCGWCYGAIQAVSVLSGSPAVQLHLMPSGLFSGPGARPMDDAFAAYAWSNDQRIERLTGQHFSERYRGQVLADHDQMFDSGPASVALTAVALTAPRRELDALKAIQRARFVDGLDVTRLETLAALLHAHDLDHAAALLVEPASKLLDAHLARVDHAQALLQACGARGVPAFILEEGGRPKLLDGSSLYANPHALLEQFTTA